MSDLPRLLDLCCGLGGASEGYVRAGFEVVGVDQAPQPAYRREFHQADCIEYLVDHVHEFDAVHISAPCQGYTWATNKSHREKYRTDLIVTARTICEEYGMPLVIENVPQARPDFREPDLAVCSHDARDECDDECPTLPIGRPITLCGEMLGLRVIRHRLFEVGEMVPQPEHPKHRGSVSQGAYLTVAGHGADNPPGGTNLDAWKQAMDIDWVTADQYGSTKNAMHQLAEAIPPAYTEYIGCYLAEWLGFYYEEATVSEPIQPGDQVRQGAKPFSHQAKLDKKGALRTMCGVPIREGNHWAPTTGELSCPTCRAAAAKGSPAMQAPTDSAVIRWPDTKVCPGNTITHGRAHTPNVLKTDLHGVVQPAWCTWCGILLDDTTSAPASDSDPSCVETQDVVKSNYGTD